MRLLRIKLDGFGQFNHGLSIKFEPGKLNLIVGKNEAGKSTLLNATAGILFGFRDLNVMRRYEPWGEHDAYAGEVEFLADDGRRIRIARDFQSGRARITAFDASDDRVLFDGSADPRGSTPDDLRYFELLDEIIGMQDESVFRGTVFVGQMNMKTAVSDQIRRLLSGSMSIDYKGALHELHARFSDITSENPWTTRSTGRKRTLDTSRDELAATEKRMEAEQARLLRFVEVESDLHAIESRKEQHLEAIRAIDVNLGAAEKLASVLGKREEAGRRADEARRRHESFESHRRQFQDAEERLRREFAQFRGVPESFQDDARAWIAETTERAREVETLIATRERLATLKPKPNRVAGAIAGGIVLAAGVAAGAMTPLGLVIGAGAGLLLGAAGFFGGSLLGTGFQARKEELDRRVTELEGWIREREKRLDDLGASTSNLLAGADPESVLENHRASVALREQVRRHQSAMKAIGEADSVAAAVADAVREQGRIEAVVVECAAQSPWLAGFTTPAAISIEITRLREERRSRDAQRESERERAERLRVEMAGLMARMDSDLPRLADVAREQRTRVRDLALEKDALKEAIDALDACIKDFQESDVFRLEEEMSRMFSRITDGKYARVHLSPALEPMVATGERVGIRPEELSAGAHDQLYFAMRIAMVRHLSRNIRLPIFLDDPFVNFDSERLGVTRDVLRSLPDHQVVMVTCDRNYAAWTDAVVDLDLARQA